MDFDEKTLNEKVVFSGRIITVNSDEVLLPNGRTSKREVVYHHGGVCVVPLTENNELLMVRQFRYPYREVILELPAGKLERGEDPYDAGLRELDEEVGVTTGEMRSLGRFYPTPGYCSEIIHIYLAENLTATHQHLDEDEFLSVEKIPLEKALGMVMSGEITDGKTQTAILKTAMLKGMTI
ncbi:MAG: NUDIX domain-containing protein [Acutalibacteraceae bacterium]|nr:NUDIX hydrolase [Oscillospiraceae bacterium]